MSKAYKYLSKEVKKLDKNGELARLWEDVYNKRYEKTNDRQKARISACSIVYSECLKRFKKDN